MDTAYSIHMWVADQSRRKRAELFNRMFPDRNEGVLDLGGGDGHHFAGSFPDRRNVCISDLRHAVLDDARRLYGYQTRQIDGSGRLPFADGEIDIIFCSSVIEHVTGPKQDARKLFRTDGRRFRNQARTYQQQFAAEIRRCCKHYFVQTPYRYFPVETHSRIPLLGLFRSSVQWRVINFLENVPIWPLLRQETDWSLLNKREMRALFPDA